MTGTVEVKSLRLLRLRGIKWNDSFGFLRSVWVHVRRTPLLLARPGVGADQSLPESSYRTIRNAVPAFRKTVCMQPAQVAIVRIELIECAGTLHFCHH